MERARAAVVVPSLVVSALCGSVALLPSALLAIVGRRAGVAVEQRVVNYTLHGIFSRRSMDVDGWHCFVEECARFLVRATQAP